MNSQRIRRVVALEEAVMEQQAAAAQILRLSERLVSACQQTQGLLRALSPCDPTGRTPATN
ncbi:MAG: hypothetical protein ABIH46_04815 [Chloroflexota bacterium]